MSHALLLKCSDNAATRSWNSSYFDPQVVFEVTCVGSNSLLVSLASLAENKQVTLPAFWSDVPLGSVADCSHGHRMLILISKT